MRLFFTPRGIGFIALGLFSWAFAAPSAMGELVFDGPWHEQEWVTQALATGELEPGVLEMARHAVQCAPSACPQMWLQAMQWLKHNGISVKDVPSLAGPNSRITSAWAALKDYPGITVDIEMFTLGQSTSITFRRLDMDEKWDAHRQVLVLMITADFNSYLLHQPIKHN